MNKYRILIVDDEKIVADGLASYINWGEIGFEAAATAYSAEEALRIIKKEKIDVLMTDIIMGPVSGLELIERALAVNPQLYSVIVSGHEEFDYARTAIRLGVYDYLVKPIEFEEVESLFGKLYQKMQRAEGNQENETKESEQEQSEGLIISRAKEYIREHFAEELSLSQLAEIVYVHPAYLSILFKKQTGENFTDFITQYRIMRAKEYLTDISLRVGDAGEKAGYKNPKYFAKLFKEFTGETPTEYRNRHLK